MASYNQPTELQDVRPGTHPSMSSAKSDPSKDGGSMRSGSESYPPMTPNDNNNNNINNDVEKTPEVDPNNPYGPAPEGGARAWMVAAGGSALFFCTLGFANSFGVFEEYYLAHQLKGQSPSTISWIGSLSIFLQFFAGIFGGPMFDRYGEKILWPAAFLYVLGIMLLSLCKEFWQFLLCQGILMGCVMGFLQFPAFGAASHYFDKKRAAALGIVLAGSSIGGIVFPVLFTKLLYGTNLGFGWSIRVVGFIILALMTFACTAIKARLPPRKTQLLLTDPVKDKAFVVLIIALFFLFFGFFMPFYYLPAYAETRGVGSSLSGYLISIVNGASTFGRVVPGVLADKYGRFNMMALGAVVTGVLTCLMNQATSNAGIIVYAVFFGLSSGTIISGAGAAFSMRTRDPQKVGAYIGIGMALAGIGALVGPPVNGAIIDHYGGYSQVSIFAGVLCLFGGALSILAKVYTEEGLWGNV